MVNYQVRVAVFLVALLGAHEVRGVSMVSNIELVIFFLLFTNIFIKVVPRNCDHFLPNWRISERHKLLLLRNKISQRGECC